MTVETFAPEEFDIDVDEPSKWWACNECGEMLEVAKSVSTCPECGTAYCNSCGKPLGEHEEVRQ